MTSKDLGIIRQAVSKNGWFVVVDMLRLLAAEQGRKELARDMERAGANLCDEIENLGGTPDYIE